MLGIHRRWRQASAFLARRARRALQRNRTVYVDERVDEYRGYWTAAARLLDAEVRLLTPSLWEIRRGNRRVRIMNYVAPFDDAVTRRIAGDKLLCYRLAAEVGAPVPEHLAFTLEELPEAQEFARRQPGSYVVKPLRDSASGLGISIGVRSRREIANAAVLASLVGGDLLLERMIPGESYRLLYLHGRLLHAVRRRGLRVVGDGSATIERLLREQHPTAPSHLDALARETLAFQNLTSASVLARGQSVLVRGFVGGRLPIRELRTVYDEPALHLIGPSLEREMEAVVRAVGSEFAGVDVLTIDPSVSLRESGGVFLELNTTPGIHHHYQTPVDRETHPVAVAILRDLLSEPCPLLTPPGLPASGQSVSADWKQIYPSLARIPS